MIHPVFHLFFAVQLSLLLITTTTVSFTVPSSLIVSTTSHLRTQLLPPSSHPYHAALKNKKSTFVLQDTSKLGRETTILYMSSSKSPQTPLEEMKQNIPEMAEFIQSKDSILSNLVEGEWGTRGETYTAAQFALLLCIVIGGIPLVPIAVNGVVGVVMILSGLVLCGKAAVDMGSSLSPWPVPTSNNKDGLITSGPFGMVRHPMYSGLLVSCTGLSLATDNANRLILTLLLGYALEVKSDYEEKQLERTFGEEYKKYQNNVPAKFVPKVWMEKLPWTGTKED